MIAELGVGRNLKYGFVHESEEKLDVSDDKAIWSDKWSVVFCQDVLIATSFRPTKNGGNIVTFELGLDGIAKLFLEKGEGGRELISESRVFEKQDSLDGILYLVYNRNGYRKAFFYSTEFRDWKKNNNISKVIRKNPNEYRVRDRRPSSDSRAVRMGGFEIYSSGKLRVITDGHIVYADAECSTKGMRLISAINAEWILLEKIRGAHIERVLVTEEPIFGLSLPTRRCMIGYGL